MRAKPSVVAAVCAVAAFASMVIVGARQTPAQLPLEPREGAGPERHGCVRRLVQERGRNVHAADGLFQPECQADARNSGGTRTTGSSRAGPTRGSRRTLRHGVAWGVFTITVPKDFGTRKLTWTITANGETTVVPLSLNPQWEISPFKDLAMGNTPPVLKFTPDGPAVDRPAARHRRRPTRRRRRNRRRSSSGRPTRGTPKARRPPAAGVAALPSASRCTNSAGPARSRSAAIGRGWPKTGKCRRPRRSRRRETTSSACRPTIRPETAAEDSSAAGPTPTSR